MLNSILLSRNTIDGNKIIIYKTLVRLGCNDIRSRNVDDEHITSEYVAFNRNGLLSKSG